MRRRKIDHTGQLRLLPTVLDQFVDGRDDESMPVGELEQVVPAGHLAIVPDYLADDRRRIKTRNPAEVDRSLSVARSPQYALGICRKQVQVPRPDKVGGFRCFIEHRRDCFGAIESRDSGCHAAAAIHGHGEGGRKLGCSSGWLSEHRNAELGQTTGLHGQTNHTPALSHHEIDDLRSGKLGGDDQVALVLPVRAIDDDDWLASQHGLGGGFNIGKPALACLAHSVASTL